MEKRQRRRMKRATTPRRARGLPRSMKRVDHKLADPAVLKLGTAARAPHLPLPAFHDKMRAAPLGEQRGQMKCSP
jgi:hypothetical protein